MVPPQVTTYPLAIPAQTLTTLFPSPSSPVTVTDSALVRQMARVVHRPERVVPNPERMVPVVHFIEKGSTLAGIAQQYGCSVDDLAQWNGLYDATIWSGDELIVYVPRLSPEESTIVRR